MQLGVVISISVRWLMLVAMRPFVDEVEFLYELMSVTGEATVMVMVCLNYFQSVAVPPAAILIGSLLIVGGNLGAQVGLTSFRFADRPQAGLHTLLANRCKRSCSAVFS
jgi:hypothetical protein